MSIAEQVQQLEADRDQWRERAEKAEADNETAGNTIHRLSARIAELERQLSSRPSTLEAVLEECRAAGIQTSVSVVDRQEFRVCVHKAGGGVSRVTYAPNTAAAVSAIESIVCSRDFYPDSAFARRRREEKDSPQPTPEPAPNYSESPNSSPSQPDPVEELLRRYPGKWSYDLHTLRLRAGNCERFCAQVPPSIGVPLAELGNRYRRIAEMLGKYIAHECGSIECCSGIRDIVRPLVREAKG